MKTSEKNPTGYDVLEYLFLKWYVESDYKYGGTFIVHFEAKYKKDNEFYKSYVLYTVGVGFDNDIWEGEDEYRIIGITPIDELRDKPFFKTNIE